MRTIQSFGRDRRGNFAIFGAILALPLLMAAGIGLDYAAMSRTRAALQQAMDSAALAIAREGTTLSSFKANQIAGEFLDENFNPAYTNMAVARDGSAVSVNAVTMVPLAFGSLFGYDKWPIKASSSADVAYASYEISLVLDTTGSMKGGKLAAMKDAVGGLVETMSNQVNDPNKLKFAVVPFANFVNVGPEHAPKFDKKGKMIKGTGADWLDLKGKVKMPQLELDGVSRFKVFNNLGIEWAGCVETRVATKKEALDTADVPATNNKTRFVPALSMDEPDKGFSNSYLVSGVDPLDMSDLAKVQKLKKYGVSADLIAAIVANVDVTDDDLLFLNWDGVSEKTNAGKGPNAACSTQPIMPLSNDYVSIVSKVNSLQANGTTNIMEGVAWGARVLSPGEPFAQGSDTAKSKFVEKIMVVLTDGANVFGNQPNQLGSSYSSYGYLIDGRLGIDAGSSQDTNALMNAKTLEACTAAKADGYTIYTIRLEEPDVATGTMLKECASGADHYFDVPSRTQLDEAFDKIKERVVRVRLAS